MDSIDTRTAILSSIRAWTKRGQLASFALARHGFGDTNGGFGVTYPGDLDEYDRQVDGCDIPAGFVEVYGHWGPPRGYSLVVPEVLYLQILSEVLQAEGMGSDATDLMVLRDRIQNE